jgi:hypothetical protein
LQTTPVANSWANNSLLQSLPTPSSHSSSNPRCTE